MTLNYKLTFFFLLLVGMSKAAFSQFSLKNYALESVNIIDVNNQKVLYNYTLIVHDAKIFNIMPANNYVPNDSIQSFKLKGKFVIPGLIDSHVHFATDPTEERRDNAEKVLKDMLLSGITSVRDMAGDARALASLSRNALVGDIDSPNLYYSSLMAGTDFFADPRTIATAKGGVSGEMPYMKAISDGTNIKLAVAEAKGTGADGIKLYANLTKDQINEIVKEAEKQDIKVWAHAALPPTKPSEIIGSGIISISHAAMLVHEQFPHNKGIPQAWTKGISQSGQTFWEQEYSKLNLEEVYAKMKASGLVLDATLSVYETYSNNEQQQWKYEMSKRITRDAHKAGVKVSAGSDTDQASFVQKEMQLLVEQSNFTPLEAVIAATKNAALATGTWEKEGSIEIGKMANLVILNNNPENTIENIHSVLYVIKSGKLYNGKSKSESK